MRLFILASLFLTGTCCAFEKPSDIPQFAYEIGVHEGLELDRKAEVKNEVATSYFAKRKKNKSKPQNSIKTSNIFYRTCDNGVTIHIAWYEDECIGKVLCVGTALDGDEKDKQVILLGTCVVGVSSQVKHMGSYVVHYYLWGEVRTYRDKQVIIGFNLNAS